MSNFVAKLLGNTYRDRIDAIQWLYGEVSCTDLFNYGDTLYTSRPSLDTAAIDVAE